MKPFHRSALGRPYNGRCDQNDEGAAGNSVNNENFSLLGDPAQRLAYPEHKVITTSINGAPVTSGVTMKALQLVTITGKMQSKTEGHADFIKDLSTVFDKRTTFRHSEMTPLQVQLHFKFRRVFYIVERQV